MALREMPAYEPFHAQYDFLFNSYYNALGPKWARNMRGALSRPTVRDIFSYRSYVDRHLMGILESGSEETVARISWLIELGIHHEQQHQELLLTDIKAILAQSCVALKPRIPTSPPWCPGFVGRRTIQPGSQPPTIGRQHRRCPGALY